MLCEDCEVSSHALQSAEEPIIHHNIFYRRVVLPVLALLRMGATPEKLAWSLAIGVAVGINPLVGSTTVLCFAVILALRLNTVAGQLANHLMYPVELALVVPFIKLGEMLFGTGPLPVAVREILPMTKRDPHGALRLLWVWEWHALVAWAMCAVVLAPVLALILTPVLRHSMAYQQRKKLRAS